MHGWMNREARTYWGNSGGRTKWELNVVQVFEVPLEYSAEEVWWGEAGFC